MSLNFDNDGPPVLIKEIDPKEIKADKIKYTHIEVLFGAAQAIVLTLIALCIAVVFSGKSISLRIVAGVFLAIGVCAVFFYFVRQWTQSKEEEQRLKNQQNWIEDQKSIHQLTGHEFVLSPATSSGNGKLRVFYKDSSEMLCVWYSKGFYHFQKTAGEGSIDFANGVVMVPNFVQIPEVTWPERQKIKEK